MDDQRRDRRKPRIAGKWNPAPTEIVQRLKKVHASCWCVYFSLVDDFYAEEDWEGDGEWVIGKIAVTKAALIEKSEISNERLFYRRAWPDLQKAGLVVDNHDGTVTMPTLKRKVDEAISVAEIKDLKDMHSRMERLEEAVDAIWGIVKYISDRIPDTGKMPGLEQVPENPSQNDDSPPSESDTVSVSSDMVSVSSDMVSVDILLNRHRLKGSLSIDKVISYMYRGIGQKRISKQKRERAKGVAKGLIQDGFNLKEILFAVDWTLENAKEQPYDFSIIQHTIGQAIAAKKKEEAKAKESEQRERAAIEEKEKREREDRDEAEIEAYRESLTPKERTALKEQAERELRESGECKEQFMSDFLIQMREKHILQKRIAEQSDQIDEEDA